VCTLENKNLDQLYTDNLDQGFLIIGVNPGGLGGGETEDDVAAFLDQTGISFPVAWDDNSYSSFAWPDSISPFPREALVGRDGTIRYLASEYHAEALQSAVETALAE